MFWGRKSWLKERGYNPYYFGETKMAQVTYRGVQYDTNRAKSQQSNKVELVYRGVKLNKDLTTAK